MITSKHVEIYAVLYVLVLLMYYVTTPLLDFRLLFISLSFCYIASAIIDMYYSTQRSLC